MNNPMNFNDWATGTYQSCDDPTRFDGYTNRSCILCDKDAENMDEYCENHQPCIMCNDNEDCGCEDEWSNVSNCCEATFYEPGYPDNDICSSCKEHAVSAWDEVSEQRNTNQTKTN